MANQLTLARALRLRPGEVVAFTGGGGKSTAMFRLANELAATQRVLMTTSTRIFAAQIKRAPAHVTFDPDRQSVGDILPALADALHRFGQVLLIGAAEPESGKAFGVPPAAIDALAASGHFDVILNEADGSRMRPFKAPAAHEPVIPARTTLVTPIVGLDVLGQPLTDEAVHRAGRVSQLSDTPLAAPVTAETIARVLCHPEGGLKSVPPQARVSPLLNKTDLPGGSEAAQALARRLLTCDKIDRVVLGAVQNAGHPVEAVAGRVAAIVLAAGGSSRFGSAKQLAPWGSATMLERVVDTALASQAEPVVVVLGAAANDCRRVLGQRPVQVVVNPEWAVGQSSSMQAGLAALPGNISAALFLLTDQPEISPAVIDAVIARHQRTLAPVVWPEFEGQRGNPALFDQTLFAELNAVTGDTGGRPVLQAHRANAERVAVAERGILLDIDRPEDLAGFD